jgi:hypothetical protein
MNNPRSNTSGHYYPIRQVSTMALAVSLIYVNSHIFSVMPFESEINIK